MPIPIEPISLTFALLIAVNFGFVAARFYYLPKLKRHNSKLWDQAVLWERERQRVAALQPETPRIPLDPNIERIARRFSALIFSPHSHS